MGNRRSKKRQRALEEFLKLALVFIALLLFITTGSILTTLIGIIIIVSLFISVLLYRKAKEKERLRRSGIATIDKMDGTRFEEYLAVLFKSKGYHAIVTKSTGDYGADLILKKDAKKVVVQAKRYTKNVGVKAVQEVHSSMNYYKADESWVVTNSYFTAAAIELAKPNKVKLVDRNALIDLMLTMNSSVSKEKSNKPRSALRL